MSGPPHNTVSASRYIHLAPAYAIAPSAAFPPSSSSRAPPPRHPSTKGKPYSQDELKHLVLEYLTHGGYLESAKAFAKQLGDADSDDPDGLDEQEGAEGVAEPPKTNGHAEAVVETNSDAMEGVEATPPPFLAATDEAEGAERVKRERTGTAGNGKTVAFENDGLDGAEDEDGEDFGVLSKEQVRDVRIRRNIRDAILHGRITHAVDLLNEHFPSVLAPSPAPSSPLPSKLASDTSSSRVAATSTPSTFFVTAPASPTSTQFSPFDSRSPSYIPITGATFGPWALSLSPEILSLNLQTQAFVEHMRTAHASSAMSAPSTPTSSVANGHTPRHLSGTAAEDTGSDAGMSASTSSLGSSSLLNVAIAQSQALREKVLKLPLAKEREGWEKECVNACGLLAYRDLAGCPVRGYLAQSRRETLAEMVNAAIMQHTDRTPLPLLALAARQTTAFWSILREMHVQFPPPPTGAAASKDRDSNNGKNKPPKTYPTFDLHAFLNERDNDPVPSSSMATE
ncbi:hypothetical protein JCM8547_004435 [Rhodosporidiobolus lusitaniae]